MATVKPGEVITATIGRIGSEGDGVGEYNGLHVIIPKTSSGDKVTATVRYVAKDRIHATLHKIEEAGNDRVAAPCQYYANCGGCELQHISDDKYKNYKLNQLTAALEKHHIPLPHDISWRSVGQHSRRRAFVRFDKVSGKAEAGMDATQPTARLGFYAPQSHNIIDIKHCLILTKTLELLLAPLKDLSLRLGINIEGWVVTDTDKGVDLSLHSDGKKIRNEGRIFKILAEFARNSATTPIARISWQRGDKIIPVMTIAKPALVISGREIILPQEYFLQASKEGQEAILSAVTQHVAHDAAVLDLFAGLGIYSFALADKISRASAYEIAPEMVEAMEANIRAHQLGDKISAYCRDIDTFPLGREELAKFDTAIINPPRTGALQQVAVLAAGQIAKIIMVSCNSSSFARDAKTLHENGYLLTHLHAIDQFYYSHHLEQVGVFERG